MGTGEVSIDLSNMTQPENPRMEKYFEIAGKCEDENWHSADSFEFNMTGPGEYDYNYKCPKCGREISSSEESSLNRMEKDYGLGREKEHPIIQGSGDDLLDYKTEELDENGKITWVKDDRVDNQ